MALGGKKDIVPTLTVDYQGRSMRQDVPGGYFRREGQPSEKEKLSSRLIDRPLRPLFPEGWYSETQVIAMVISADQSGSSDILGIIAASAALAVSNIPFNGPVGAVRVGRRDGQFVINPDLTSLEGCDLNLVVAGTADGVRMVEGGAAGLPEDVMIAAIEHAHQEIKRVWRPSESLARQRKIETRGHHEQIEPALRTTVKDLTAAQICKPPDSQQDGSPGRRDEICRGGEALKKEGDPDASGTSSSCSTTGVHEVRKTILENGKRADVVVPPNSTDHLRGSLLPRTHGSALFTKGDAGAGRCDAGTSDDEQRIDAPRRVLSNLHAALQFPLSAWERRVLALSGPTGDRSWGLGERALKSVLPRSRTSLYLAPRVGHS